MRCVGTEIPVCRRIYARKPTGAGIESWSDEFNDLLLEVGKDDDFSTIQVRSTAGDNRLGGDDWDQRVRRGT